MMAYLRLLRLPALFTTFPDVLAGYAVVKQGVIVPWELAFLLLASGLLYLSGMVFNDVFDFQQDAEERPGRPLPAGEISRRTAAGLGAGLMLGGIVSASLVGGFSLVMALILAGFILAYDAGGKKTLAGPLLMGLCRSANLLLGASCVATVGLAELQWPLILAGLIGLYVMGITIFARSEAVTSPRSSLLLGSLFLLAALVGWGAAAMEQGDPSAAQMVLLMLLLIGFQLTRRVVPAIKTGEPLLVQQGVRMMLLTIPMLEAVAILAHGSPNSMPLAIAAALMMVPGQILSRYISMT